MTAPQDDIARGRAKGFAITSMITSIVVGLFTFGLLSFFGAILGHVAMAKIKSSGATENKGFAWAGIIIGWVLTIFSWLILISIIRAATGETAVDGSLWDQFTNQFQNT